VVGATVDRPLHPHHHSRRLQPRHDPARWRGLRPLPADIPADGALGPQRLSMGSSGLVVCCPWLGACPNWDAPAHGPSSSSCQGEEEGEEEEEDAHRITVVTSPVGPPAIHRTTQISIGPRGRPQGPLAPQTTTTTPTSLSPSLDAPPPLPALPSSEVVPLDLSTPLDLKSSCNNWLLHRFAHFAAPSDKGQAPRSWDSTAGERSRKRGSNAEEQERVDKVQRRRRSPRGGAPDLATVEPSTPARKAEQVDRRSGAAAENNVACG
jgi:hypothetical protein